jgi:hypothetical protein
MKRPELLAPAFSFAVGYRLPVGCRLSLNLQYSDNKAVEHKSARTGCVPFVAYSSAMWRLRGTFTAHLCRARFDLQREQTSEAPDARLPSSSLRPRRQHPAHQGETALLQLGGTRGRGGSSKATRLKTAWHRILPLRHIP